MIGAGIDLWWFSLPGGSKDDDQTASRAAALLDAAERVRHRQFELPAAARSFAFRRAARRIILANHCGLEPGELVIAETSEGKAYLARPAANIEFSASDSGHIGVVTVAQGFSLGVDIEIARPLVPKRLADRVLSPAERIVWMETPTERRTELLLRAWTAKEAIVKGLGTGLDLSVFRSITIPLTAGFEEWRQALLPSELSVRESWLVYARRLVLTTDEPMLAAIAAPVAAPVIMKDAASLLRDAGLA